MINLQFNSNCPVCNSLLTNRAFAEVWQCENCATLNKNVLRIVLTYRQDFLQNFDIYLADNTAIRLSFQNNFITYFTKVDLFYESEIFYVCNYIPEFSSISEIVDIVIQMADIKLNYTCPFCNHHLILGHPFIAHLNGNSHNCNDGQCQNCINANQNISDVRTCFNEEQIYKINIYLQNNISYCRNLISINFVENSIYYFNRADGGNNKYEICNYIPEFSSIQDIIQICNMMLLFK